VLAVLQAFSPQFHTLTARDMADSTGIPLPSMYRYIALLRDMGLLVGDDRGSYHLSAKLISLARAAEAAESIIELADPVMRELMNACGETVILVRLIARTPVCVHRVESTHHLRATFEPGQTLPLERGASGRLLLAGLPSRLRGELLAPLANRDPEAAEHLEDLIQEAAERGWAVSEEEIDHGVWAASAAVTDGRSTVAALTVPSPLVRAPAELQGRLLGQVRSAARALSRELREMRHSYQSDPRRLRCTSPTIILPICRILRTRPSPPGRFRGRASIRRRRRWQTCGRHWPPAPSPRRRSLATTWSVSSGSTPPCTP
jgi:DNA-binding IclR family transcriptional regulator